MTSDRANITSGLSNRARRALAVFAAAGLATATLGIAAVAQTIAPGTTIPRITPISPLGVGSGPTIGRRGTAGRADDAWRDDDADAHAENAGTDPNDHDHNHIDGDTDQQLRHPDGTPTTQYRPADARRHPAAATSHFSMGANRDCSSYRSFEGFGGRPCTRVRRTVAKSTGGGDGQPPKNVAKKAAPKGGATTVAANNFVPGEIIIEVDGAVTEAQAIALAQRHRLTRVEFAEFSADRRDHVPLAHPGQPLDRHRFAPAAGRRQRPLRAAQLSLCVAAGRDCEGRSRVSTRSTSSTFPKRMR